MTKRIGLFLLIFVFVFGLTFVAKAEKYQEYQLTNDTSDQWQAKIYYPYAAWIDWQYDADKAWVADGGKDGANNRALSFYNIDNSETKKVTAVDDNVTHFDITDSHVFWLDTGARPGLHFYDIVNDKFAYVTEIANYPANSDYGGTFIAAWTNKVIYTTAGSTGVFMFDVSSGLTTKITDTFVNGLDYDNGMIVYTDTNVFGANVYKYEVATAKETLISATDTKAASFSDNISIRGDNVIWQVGGNKPNIYNYDLETGEVFSMTIGEVSRTYPRAGVQKSVWAEVDGDNSYIGIYDYGTGETNFYSVEGASVSWPDVFGTKVVFTSSRDGLTEIYYIDTEMILNEIPVSIPADSVKPDNASKVYKLADLKSGDLVKGEAHAAVYYYGANNKRFVFPTEKTYSTWYENFDNVKTISDKELAMIDMGGNITYRPGVKMIMATTGNKVYAVDKGGVRRWIENETVAKSLYGNNWQTLIEKIPDAFWSNYIAGINISQGGDYTVSTVKLASPTINIDKGL